MLVEGERTRHDALEREELTTFPGEELLAKAGQLGCTGDKAGRTDSGQRGWRKGTSCRRSRSSREKHEERVSGAVWCGVEHTGRLGGVQDGRREGSLHGEHGAPMERVPWITASIKGLTVTGLKSGLGANKRAAGGGRQTGVQQETCESKIGRLGRRGRGGA